MYIKDMKYITYVYKNMCVVYIYIYICMHTSLNRATS